MHLFTLTLANNHPLLDERRPPVESHAHAYPAHDEELRDGRLRTHFPQLKKFAQRVRAIQNPDPGIGHRGLDFTPPFIDQMRGCYDQRAAIAFLIHERSGCNRHDGVG